MVACENDRPVAVNQSITINEDNIGNFIFTSGASDNDPGDTLALSGFISNPSNGTISNT